MRKLYVLIAVCCLAQLLSAQAFYNVTFNSGAFPAGWSPSDSRVFVINNAASCCYFSSPTSPQFSAEENVIFQHCVPPGSSITLTIANVINTVGKTNIRVGFGRRRTNAWDRPVALEWSSDGSNWNLIDNDVSAIVTPFSWESIYFDLPAGADNLTNLRFRFSYTTTTNANCDVGAANFRIDDFTVGENFSLPAELTRFEARPVRQQVQLNWSTASETDNDYFAVEHSADGAVYTELGQIAGAGTTRIAQDYTFWHTSPAAGMNFYRLRQVDRNGQAAYSTVRTAEVRGAQAYRLYPSPAVDWVYVEAEGKEAFEGACQWLVYDAMGRLIVTGTAIDSGSKLSIPVGDLPQGRYSVQVLRENAAQTTTFIKM